MLRLRRGACPGVRKASSARLNMAPLALSALALAGGAMPHDAQARVTRLVVERTRVFADGAVFGAAGPYQRLDGVAYFAVDPRDPHNAGIVDIDRAPRNAAGMVEFSAPFFVLKPADISRGNHKVFLGINNRGSKQALGYFNNVPPGPGQNDPITGADAGDGFLMKQGWSVVDVGWQGDVLPGDARMVPSLPVAAQADGSPIVGPVRIEYSDRTIPRKGAFSLTLEGGLTGGSPMFDSYETADTNTAASTLTMRDAVDGRKTPISADRWAFGACPQGPATLTPSTRDICLFDGFKPDRLYELIYPAKNPKVLGLGYVVTRDLASFLRNQTHDDVGHPNPLAASPTEVGVTRVYAFGSSSTAMYLREFLYLGFNEDEAGRRAFDALWIHKSGAHRLFANVRFADPNTYSREDDRQDFLSASVAPLTYQVARDPVSGITDGLLKRPGSDPLVFDTDTSSEFWQMNASLKVHDGRGRPIAPPPRKVRLYLLNSLQHNGVAPVPVPGPAGVCLNDTNTTFHGPTMRALLGALDDWADKGIAPPPSNFARLEDGGLVSVSEYAALFPSIPGVAKPGVVNGVNVLDYGPDFGSTGGRLTVLPPKHGAAYAVRVPRPDRDGLDVAGVTPIEVAAPIATLTGWNLRAAGARAPHLCALAGSYIPFKATRLDRLRAGDPRLSLEERYRTHAGYVAAVKRAAKDLVRRRFLLPEDAAAYVRKAEDSDILTKPAARSQERKAR